ncbi:NAD(P)H-dependent oxidoreductase [Conexibacter stalactiti]|uniref:NAD(P)H-dependent oxidoreductase n=1 Tax=Conexibacter stalactiti TaxID=1940611 RepID=A0ABU4HJM0_9ACTN|nr:NAD(P)H-dependent oxidoreductase [Conexibacter stalactiti]MDW5593523.1 NAD(P)H-dependent oxidoreductase [Conexibacter stalactiti]MEC5034164.1 NAD(P)H-dependent oxidoreductase [Conexibacter stalactiti]
MRVLGIPGSVRQDSHNRKLLRAAAATLPSGVELELWDRLAELPHFDEDLERGPAPAAVQELRDAIAGADAVLISTPEYNAGVPGVLKNAIDWISRPFESHPLRDKPVAVVGASTGLFGAVWAQAEVRRVAAHIGARVLDHELPVGLADGAFGDDGTLSDPEQVAALAAVVQALVDDARVLEKA